jgi:hypothetical protein
VSTVELRAWRVAQGHGPTIRAAAKPRLAARIDGLVSEIDELLRPDAPHIAEIRAHLDALSGLVDVLER